MTASLFDQFRNWEIFKSIVIDPNEKHLEAALPFLLAVVQNLRADPVPEWVAACWTRVSGHPRTRSVSEYVDVDWVKIRKDLHFVDCDVTLSEWENLSAEGRCW